MGIYKKSLFRILRNYPRHERLSILDVGTGSADLSTEVLRRCRTRYPATLTGLDVQPQFLALAKHRYSGNGELNLVASDALSMPFIDNSFDIVISNLVLHHFYEQAGELLEEMFRVARFAVVVNDLLRHSIPLTFFRLFSPLFIRSSITKNDGEISIRRAFTFSEVRRLMQDRRFEDYYFVRHWSYRFGLVIWKKRW